MFLITNSNSSINKQLLSVILEKEILKKKKELLKNFRLSFLSRFNIHLKLRFGFIF
jgi:hypothetical protein